LFDEYLTRWALTPDGAPIVTHSSRLLPVRLGTTPAMLKVAIEHEEKFGGVLMAWWDGDGAARVLAGHDGVLLLERATGPQSLSAFARDGRDEEATRIICATTARLHAPRDKSLPALIPLAEWFAALWPAAETHGGVLARSAMAARALLADPREVGVLHGDIHHDNILDFGTRGWLAIDPKRLVGERGFDYANLFCNPDRATASDPLRFRRRVDVVAETAGLDRTRLLHWILAWAGLSAAWFIGDNMSAETDFAVAAMAEAELQREGRSIDGAV
jgi:streptomycin 6-kinase